MKYLEVNLEKYGDEGYIATCPEFGLFAIGKTMDEVVDNIVEQFDIKYTFYVECPIEVLAPKAIEFREKLKNTTAEKVYVNSIKKA